MSFRAAIEPKSFSFPAPKNSLWDRILGRDIPHTTGLVIPLGIPLQVPWGPMYWHTSNGRFQNGFETLDLAETWFGGFFIHNVGGLIRSRASIDGFSEVFRFGFNEKDLYDDLHTANRGDILRSRHRNVYPVSGLRWRDITDVYAVTVSDHEILANARKTARAEAAFRIGDLYGYTSTHVPYGSFVIIEVGHEHSRQPWVFGIPTEISSSVPINLSQDLGSLAQKSSEFSKILNDDAARALQEFKDFMRNQINDAIVDHALEEIFIEFGLEGINEVLPILSPLTRTFMESEAIKFTTGARSRLLAELTVSAIKSKAAYHKKVLDGSVAEWEAFNR